MNSVFKMIDYVLQPRAAFQTQSNCNVNANLHLNVLLKIHDFLLQNGQLSCNLKIHTLWGSFTTLPTSLSTFLFNHIVVGVAGVFLTCEVVYRAHSVKWEIGLSLEAVIHYLELQNIWSFFQYKSSFSGATLHCFFIFNRTNRKRSAFILQFAPNRDESSCRLFRSQPLSP